MVLKKDMVFFKNFLIVFCIFLLFPKMLFSAQNYDFAIHWAREGKYEKALQVLERFYIHEPENKQLLYDYITVLSWAQKNRLAIKLAQKIDIHKAPAYVLQSIGKAARNAKMYKIAVRTYITGAKRFPKNSEFYKALSQTLQELHKDDLARRVLQKAMQRFPDKNDLKLTLAALYEHQKNFFDAMVIYQDLLQRSELYDSIIVKLVGTLRKLGMVFEAQKYIDQNPHLFDNAVKNAIQSDQAAYKLRWYTQGFHPDGDETKALQILQKIEKVIASFSNQKANIHTNKRLQNAYFDKIVALHALQKDREVITLYRTLLHSQINIPSYVLKAVAKSYLVLKKPKKAQSILITALRQTPKDFMLKIELFYAYSDANEMDKALTFARYIDKQEAPKIWDSNHLHKIPNPRKDDTVFLYTLALAYSGYTPKACASLEYIVAKAPMNRWYREELAKFYFYRGWYTKARKQLEILLANNPSHFEAKAAKIEIDIAQKEYKSAYTALQNLAFLYPYKKRELSKLYTYYIDNTKGMYTVATTFNRGDQTSLGQNSDGHRMEVGLYTPLLNYHWRLGIFGDLLQSKFTGNKLENRRYGISTTYVSKKLDADLNIAYNETTIKKIAPSFSLGWRLNDFFSLGGSYAHFWDGTPDRAILNGIRADHFRTNLVYSKNENSHISFMYANTKYTDGNSQNTLALSADGRIIYGACYTLDGAIYTGIGKNTLTNRVYYAPEEERYITVSLHNSWNLYRLYEREVVQKLGLDIGKHWEKGYTSKITGALTISQEWSWNENFNFNFGFKRDRASYDGQVEYLNQLFLNMNGRF